MFEYSHYEYNILYNSMKYINSISIILAFFSAITYLLFKRKYPSTLATHFTIYSLIIAISLEIGIWSGFDYLFENAWLCKLQGISLQFFGSILIWNYLLISYNLQKSIVYNKFEKRIKPIYYVIVLVLAAVQTVIPVAFNEVKPLGLWCWIDDSHGGLFQFLSLYLWMGLVSIFSLVIWFRVIYVIKKRIRVEDEGKQRIATLLVRHILFVIVFSVIFTVMFLHRLYVVIDQKPNFILALSHLIALSSQGLFVFICFTLSYSNFNLWRNFFTCKKTNVLGTKSNPRITYLAPEDSEQEY